MSNLAILRPVSEVLARFRESAAALAGVFANPGLRRIELAFAGSSIGSYAYSITLAVSAFRAGSCCSAPISAGSWSWR